MRELSLLACLPSAPTHPVDERCRPRDRSVRIPPPSGEARVPLYGRHRLFSELRARDTHTHTHSSRGGRGGARLEDPHLAGWLWLVPHVDIFKSLSGHELKRVLTGCTRLHVTCTTRDSSC